MKPSSLLKLSSVNFWRGDDGRAVGIGVEGGLPARVTSFFMLISVGSGLLGLILYG